MHRSLPATLALVLSVAAVSAQQPTAPDRAALTLHKQAEPDRCGELGGPAQNATADDELKHLQGAWTPMSVEFVGRKSTPPEEVKTVIAGNRITSGTGAAGATLR